MSLDEQDWSRKAEQSGNDEIDPVTLKANRSFLNNARTFFLRVRMTNHAKASGASGNRLDHLTVECIHKPPQDPNATARLSQDVYGNLSYDDDFSTPRWKRLGRLQVAHKGYGGYRGPGFWVGIVDRRASSVHLVQRITAPREIKELVVAVDGKVHSKSLGGHLDLGVAPRGQAIRWKTSTDEKAVSVHSEQC